MEKDIKTLMDNYNHETATPEEKEEAMRFMNFLDHQMMKNPNFLRETLERLEDQHIKQLQCNKWYYKLYYWIFRKLGLRAD
jgi:hypothetical protein